MKIISHRGFWNDQIKPNSLEAFSNALKKGYGIEFDVRDLDEKIVVSHDLPKIADNNLSLEDFFKLYNSFDDKPVLAINIKSDGMQKQIKTLIENYRISNYFLFDMSVPDAISYYKNGLSNIYTRQSEYEQNPSFYQICKGVWIDEFKEQWVDKETIKFHLDNKKEVIIVSPELHKKDSYQERWKSYKEFDLKNAIGLCTDYPDEANLFFNKNDR